MKETIDQVAGWTEEKLSTRGRQAAVFVVVFSVLVGGVAAQTLTADRTDTFEDESPDGWDGFTVDGTTYPTVVASPSGPESIGNYSLYAPSDADDGEGDIVWRSGPILNTDEEFTTTAVFRPEWIDDETSPAIRIGLASSDTDAVGQNAFILFNDELDVTYLGTYNTAPVPSNTSNRIENDFDSTWVNVKISSSGDGTVRAKVWPVGTAEPADWQLEKSFDGTTGQFGFNTGTSGGAEDREAWLDSVTVQGTLALDPSLNLQTRQLYRHGSTHSYDVYELRNESGNNRSYKVTENASVSSLNETLLTVNESNQTLTATSNKNLSGVVIVRAMYNNSTTYTEVVVAEPTVENLDIVPGVWRVVAIGLDPTMFALLIATLLAVPAARYTSAFGGLAIGEMVIVVGWLGGYIGFGIAAVSVFVSLFIGLNLAANINYMGGRLGGGR